MCCEGPQWRGSSHWNPVEGIGQSGEAKRWRKTISVYLESDAYPHQDRGNDRSRLGGLRAAATGDFASCKPCVVCIELVT